MDQSKYSNFKSIMDEIHHTVHLLYYPTIPKTRKTLLKKLEEQLNQLSQFFILIMPKKELDNVVSIPVQDQDILLNRSELSKYNGKNGNPAYVAVDGIVYDVTDNAAWAAAVHFGLSAGRDLTGAHASCHADRDVLSKLRVVGRLEDGVDQL